MDADEKAIFDALFHDLLQTEARPWRPTKASQFWHAAWAASDVIRLYRKHARDWREADAPDWADQLEEAADRLEAEWDARIRAFHEAS
jgi:hypothetical protein